MRVPEIMIEWKDIEICKHGPISHDQSSDFFHKVQARAILLVYAT